MPDKLDFALIRARLSGTTGKVFWRSLEELADTGEFQELLHHEFPRQAAGMRSALNRRDFMKLMAASLALAGLSACGTQPAEKIVPYVKKPEQIVPGKPLFFATAVTLNSYALGVLAESHEGRPTKIEGNPDHPASLGSTDAFAQAAVLALYDPDRSQTVTLNGQISTWDAFVAALGPALNAQQATRGRGLRILTGSVTSPTLASQIYALLTQYPQARWHQYEPVNRDNLREGARLAFKRVVQTRYDFRKADVILSLDSDFLRSPVGGVRYAREFTDRRRVRSDQKTMNRLYAVESTPTITGAMADHRLPQRAGQIESFARALAQKLGLKASPGGLPHNVPDYWLTALVRDLQQHRGASVIVPGDYQPPIVHAFAHAMNNTLGNVGKTVIYTDPVEVNPVNHTVSLRTLASHMQAGKVELLVIIGGNPVFNAPADLHFADALSKVKLRIHLSLYEDETSALCHWHIPESHVLEGWSDARAYDGTVTIIQPLIAPLYGSRSPHQLLSALLDQPDQTDHDIVRNYWQGQQQGGDSEMFWKTALHDGLIAGSALPPRPVTLRTNFATRAGPSPANADAMEIIFQPDPTIWDGRFANNAWLQELPKPLTLLTWDNVAMISPATAQRLGLSSEDLVDLRYQNRTVRAPIWIMPGHPDNSVTVYFGYGRTRAGQVGSGTGFNAYAIRPSNAPWFGLGVQIEKTGQTYTLASTQHHASMEGRDIVRTGTLDQFIKNPDFLRGENPAQSLYPQYEYKEHAWGLSIDQSVCIGCNACIIACQAENNIPVVGKTEIEREREMHWLRVVRYYEGDLDNPATDFQPVPCMQCENAPCEPVCPVGATVHSDEGLNDMVYNRCVGTRYCSNNCPYKVRHFNFFQFADWKTASLKALRNPDVSVRERGVMEKCTYCVQRIQAVKIDAEKSNRPIRDGEIRTACQQVCPAEAIIFGDINDPNSQVARLKAQPTNYALLADLNTRPRTTYLARLRNPNPEIEAAHGTAI